MTVCEHVLAFGRTAKHSSPTQRPQLGLSVAVLRDGAGGRNHFSFLTTKTQQAQLSLGHQAISPPSPSHEVPARSCLGSMSACSPRWFAAFWSLGRDAQSSSGSTGMFLTICFLLPWCQGSLIFQCPSKLLPAPGGELSPSPPTQHLALIFARFWLLCNKALRLMGSFI